MNRIYGSSTPVGQSRTLAQAKLTFTGDIMVHEWQLEYAYNEMAEEYDFQKSFQRIKPYILNADFAAGNLETTFAGQRSGYSSYPCFNTPESLAFTLKNIGLDFLSTANNHCNDKGWKGILRTIDVLDAVGIDHGGTYKTVEARDQIYIKNINGIEFAFICCTYGTNGIELAAPHLANVIGEMSLEWEIQKAKALNPDFIVVLPHIGIEYQQTPGTEIREWVKTVLEYGADIVIASHPHVLQPMEYIYLTDANGNLRTCFAAYSMGNLISSQRVEPCETGMLLNLYFEKTAEGKAQISKASFTPTWVQFLNRWKTYEIQVLPIYDVLLDIRSGAQTSLYETDIDRIEKAYRRVVRQILGEDADLEAVQQENFLYPIVFKLRV